MVLTYTILNMERSNQCSKNRKEEEEDRMGKLPDEISRVILSKYLPVTQIAKTSSVSRRWKVMCEDAIAFTRRLEFNDLSVSSQKGQKRLSDYVNWVNQVLRFHSAPTLEEFAIAFASDSTYSCHIDSWVEFAAKKRVKKLKLDLWDPSEPRSGSIKPYNGYVVANLRMNCVRDLLMTTVDMGEEQIQCLLSNSPSLERLCVTQSIGLYKLEVAAHQAPTLKYLEIFKCRNLLSLNISAPCLEHLAISDHFLKLNLVDICAPNLESLFISNNQLLKQLKICAPNLMSFTFHGISATARTFMAVPASHLSRACLGFRSLDTLDSVQELLGQISQVNRLKLKIRLEVFNKIGESIGIYHQFPELSNLEHLEISIPHCRIHNMVSMPANKRLRVYHDSILWPFNLMKAAPFLHCVSFMLLDKQDHDFILRNMDFKYTHVKEKPNIKHTHEKLKVVKFVGFTGCRNEVELLLNLVDFAVSLEQIIIDVRLPSNSRADGNPRENPYAEMCRKCARKYLTGICPKIDVAII